MILNGKDVYMFNCRFEFLSQHFWKIMIWEIEQKMYRNTIALYNRLETVEF